MRTQATLFTWMTDTIAQFKNELALHKSKPTVDAYSTDIVSFLSYLYEKKVKRACNLKEIHIIDYLGFCKREGKEDSSINRYYMSIRSFTRFLRRIKLIEENLTENIKPPKNQIKAPRIPTLEEVNRILEQPYTGTESGIRDRAIMELLYSSGLRASELCALQLHHVGEDFVQVVSGKRGKTRTVPITPEAHEWMTRYIKLKRGMSPGPLFQTLMRKGIRRQFLFSIVRGYAKQANVEGVTTHTLRHACATHLLDSGADLRLIQEVLGHSSIASTQRYTHLSSNKMQEMFQHFHPRKQQLQEALV